MDAYSLMYSPEIPKIVVGNAYGKMKPENSRDDKIRLDVNRVPVEYNKQGY